MALNGMYLFNQVRFKEQYVRTRCYICLTATVQFNRSNRLLAFLLTVYTDIWLLHNTTVRSTVRQSAGRDPKRCRIYLSQKISSHHQ